VGTLAVFSIFTCIILASKKAWSAVVIMAFTQLPALYLFHRWAGGCGLLGCGELAGGTGTAMHVVLHAG
jgi:hypothetical protein